MNVTYTLSKRIASDGCAELLVRFYSGRACDVQAHTGIRVPVAHWDTAAGSLRIPKRNITPETATLIQKQQQVDALTSHLYDAYARLCGHFYRGWLQCAIETFHGLKSHVSHPLPDYVLRYASKQDVAPSTRKRYGTLACDVKGYTVEGLTVADLQTIATKLKRSHAANTVSSRLKSLRAVLNLAVSEGIIERNPFERYKIPAERYGSVVYLTAAERDTLYRVDLPTVHLRQQRDVFIFQCWTGCRISDLYNLKEWNITADGCLEYIQHKLRRSTPTVVRVPLAPEALAILNRYRYHQRLLPFISMQQYNRAIKQVIAAAGIDRDVLIQDPRTLKQRSVRLSQIASSHLARRTFAEIAFAQTGSERVVSAMTGHSPNSKAFRRYTEVDDTMKRTALGISPEKIPT